MKASKTPSLAALLCGLSLLGTCLNGQAQDPNYTTQTAQGSGNNGWNEAIWQPGPVGNPSAGNTYTCLNNGVNFGTSVNNTRVRNPNESVIPAGTQTFGGDSLILNTNTEFRLKNTGSTGLGTFGAPTLNFPGGNSLAGLVLNGGVINVGDAASGGLGGVFSIQGVIQVLAQSYINGGGNGGGSPATADIKAVHLDGQLIGGGNLMIFQFTTNAIQVVSGNNNTFSGQWIVKAGWLQGSGVNSLGTNSVTVDPNAPYPSFFGTMGAWSGPAIVEFGYDATNSGGLSLLNGGKMCLHQNLGFGQVIIQGVSLAPGTYTYAQLTNTYPANFLTNGSGSLTVAANGPNLGFTAEPVSETRYPTQNASFTVSAYGPNLTYHWLAGVTNSGVFTNLSDAGNISGSATATLTITNLAAANQADYIVVISNSSGSVTSIVATLTINPTLGGATNITSQTAQLSGPDWDQVGYWSTGLSASDSAAAYPGSTFELLANTNQFTGTSARLRSTSGSTNAVFPGISLQVDGDGVWEENGVQTIAEFLIKNGGSQSTPAYLTIPKLIMNGGQISDGPDGGYVNVHLVLQGQMVVVSNTPIYSAGTLDHHMEINSQLSGKGNIQYYGYDGGVFVPAFTNGLYITGAANTYSGTWDVVAGIMYGCAANSLGTNNITVEGAAGFETTYDLNSPAATLQLNNGGQVYLHQNDTFGTVLIASGGVTNALPPGTYSVSDLQSNYAASFPLSWPLHASMTTSNASGTLTVVGVQAAPPVIILTGSGAQTQLSWPAGDILLQTTNLSSGVWSTNPATPPFIMPMTGPQMFYRVLAP